MSWHIPVWAALSQNKFDTNFRVINMLKCGWQETAIMKAKTLNPTIVKLVHSPAQLILKNLLYSPYKRNLLIAVLLTCAQLINCELPMAKVDLDIHLVQQIN